MSSKKDSKPEPWVFDPPDWLIGTFALAIMAAIVYVVIGLVDTVTDPVLNRSEMSNLLDYYEDRTRIAQELSIYLNKDKLADTTALDTAIRETERAHLYTEFQEHSLNSFKVLMKKYADLDVALSSVYKPQKTDLNYLGFVSRLLENSNYISQHIKSYNKSAIEFNDEYSRSFPERYMGRDPRILLPETEPLGSEFAQMYGTPAPK